MRWGWCFLSMATYHAKGIPAALTLIKRHMRQRTKRIEQAIKRTARSGAAHVRRNCPVAFSELRDSVHVEGARIIADAPHAAALEVGSRPHWPPLEPLIAWVKLRGFQGLVSTKQRGRLPGTTTAAAASSVAGAIASLESGGAVPIDAAEQVARAIQFAIAKRGTKPHWYMRGAVPFVTKVLHTEIQKAVPDRVGK
jgi:hypothetical protein